MNNRDFFARIFDGAWHKRTSSWGWRTYAYLGKRVTDFHLGVDEASGKSNKLYPAEYGYVTKIGKDKTSGNYVYIYCAGVEHFYCHLSAIYVKVGQVVSHDTLIGMSGNTGHSTAIHLHFGIKQNGKWINPDAWIAAFSPSVTRTMYVNSAKGLNIRKSPSILASKITAIKDNTKVVVYLTYKGWAWIKSGTVSGWVVKEYLSTKR